MARLLPVPKGRAAAGPAWREMSVFMDFRAMLQILKGGNLQNRLYLKSHEQPEGRIKRIWL